MNIFIDKEDMEERYGEELYKEYLEKENKRLNNIINELEKWLKDLMTPKENFLGDITYNMGIRVDVILDKLKELKENK